MTALLVDDLGSAAEHALAAAARTRPVPAPAPAAEEPSTTVTSDGAAHPETGPAAATSDDATDRATRRVPARGPSTAAPEQAARPTRSDERPHPDRASSPGTTGRAAVVARPAGPRARLVRPAAPARVLRAAGPHHLRVPTLAERLDVLRVQDRSPVLDAADEDRGAVPDADPAAFAGRLALATVEVLGGHRPAGQLARWLTPGVLDALQVRAAITQRVHGARPTARSPQLRRVRACAVDPHTLEACAVVDDGPVVRAVAVRLETHRGTWRATVLEIG
ncbi:Rv3235 family protein [Cellulomonas fimi]|uniref:Uncharacterized protein n=1 Tax=Cellulomonas fimi (strain ATCC 484 / DSM 20113 / JCM 1341 / CCUG 24087 / LMG 16345 / NBRC 15513 / NCIMB 8980 / NCTC 7547 / NRS-133) TaxID=590998 RepID=F4H4B5_CELFA|nr:Rv3235 family protein [Cellulomonas fimi]AEE46591.1 hypothetical protein Celf_2465 [Cellulomonas fimi ATCC 484]NNH09021.1 hypothetical protein [Cellulomonas fimi]VEH33604.1 Uncharacterised protein [Cellulomonas fimi]